MPVSSWSRGVAVSKAIFVRHTPRDYSKVLGRKGTGAIAIDQGSVKDALDYAGREGKWAGKSDIEREETAYDRNLRDAAELADRLDYIGRQGAYERKGAGRQADATYWDQSGPVSRERVERSMRQAGGAFVDSFISVSREDAARLGLQTKEDFERLVRATWAKNVERWGLIRNPEDIRYVACYHTDAPRSLHVHLYTWSARGEISPGQTVPREGTREGKEIIYRHGYARIREERNERSNFLRDFARFEALRQLGRHVPERDATRLDEKARRLGIECKLSARPDVPEDRRAGLERLEARLASALERGEGRLVRNWEAQSAARDIVRFLEKESPSFARVSADYRECAEVKADLKGYGRDFAHERGELVKAEREEYLSRLASRIVREYLPPDARERYESNRSEYASGERVRTPEECAEARQRAAERREREARERQEAQSRLSDDMLRAQNRVGRAYGIRLDDIQRMGREVDAVHRAVSKGASSFDDLPGHAQRAARSYAARAVDSPRMREVLERGAANAAQRSGADHVKTFDGLRSASIDRFARDLVDKVADGRVPNLDDGREGPVQSLGLMAELGSVAESAVRSMCYAACRGGIHGSRDREQERQRLGIDLRDEELR